ncbi:MAG: hypothetical protein R2751_08735 [Bacteroidales bacterium]
MRNPSGIAKINLRLFGRVLCFSLALWLPGCQAFEPEDLLVIRTLRAYEVDPVNYALEGYVINPAASRCISTDLSIPFRRSRRWTTRSRNWAK